MGCGFTFYIFAMSIFNPLEIVRWTCKIEANYVIPNQVKHTEKYIS